MITNKIYGLLIGLFLMSGNYMIAQTGIYTQEPSRPLQIDGAKDNSATPTTSELNNDVIVTSDGRLGVGVLNPATKVDVRSSDQKGIIGVGTNATQTAASAGTGAIRYSTGNIIQYSDGVAWHNLPVVLPPKVLILANKSTSQSIAQNSNTEYITGWSEVEDTYNNFNDATGTFSAPRDGFYIVSFNLALVSAAIGNNTRVENIIESSSTTNNIGAYRNVNSYPAWDTSGTQSNIIGGVCNAIFNLKTGDTIRFRVWHNLGGNRSTRTAGNGGNNSDNSISIYEL